MIKDLITMVRVLRQVMILMLLAFSSAVYAQLSTPGVF